MGIWTLLRRSAGRPGNNIGLGWLLALAIGGAVLLFAAVGLFLSWKIRSRNEKEENTREVYPVSGSLDEQPRPTLTKRLVKRKLLAESTSRLSLSLPPILPPLPTYHSFGFFTGQGTRSRSRSWVEEDEFHGPKMNKATWEGWFSRDHWFGRMPTLPSVVMLGDDADNRRADHVPEQRLVVQRHQSLPNLKPGQVASELSSQEESPRGRLRLSAETLKRPPMRPSKTDSSLHEILRSTEERLRDGTSTSPTKTPRSSPLKASPVKTPHSYRPASSAGGTVRLARMTPSPSKRAAIQVQTPHTQSRNASISSAGSATNSLIAEATQELAPAGGLSSPSRMRGKQWEQGGNNVPEQGRPRSKSLDSHASSSLSTLYSVGEPEERKTELNRALNEQDPFVEKDRSETSSWESKAPLFGPRSLNRPTQTMSAARNPDTLTARLPFRQPAYSTQAVGGLSLSTVLQPPSELRFSEEVSKNTRGERIALAFPVSTSETSMVTPSVTTVTDDDEDDSFLRSTQTRDTPRPEWIPPTQRNSLRITSPTPTSTAASSPYDERDMLSLLLSSTAPRRALLDPPLHGSHVDESRLPTPLSPLPTRDSSQQLRQISNASNSSSVSENGTPSDEPGVVSTGSSSRHTIIQTLREPPPQGSVGSAIQELRRMNSMLSSSYSLASLTSEAGSPGLPALRGGGFAPISETVSIGRQNYLNLGISPNNRQSRGRPVSQTGAIGQGVEICEDETDEGKENQSSDQKTPRADVSHGLREGRLSSGNEVRDSLTGKTKLRPVGELFDEHKRQDKRQSAQRLGLYGGGGFPRSSPERDAKGRSLWM